MASRIGQKVTAGIVMMTLGFSAITTAHAQSPVPTGPATDAESNAAPIATITVLENSTPRPVSGWKIDDVSRARWVEQEPAKDPAGKRPKANREKRKLGIILMAIGGAAAGAWFGSKVQGSLCECDDEGLTGGLYGGLAGGAISALIGLAVFR